MSRQPVVFVQENFYHVFARGNRKQPIFFIERDYQRFLEKIEEYKKKYAVELIAFCLIPNHLHLLLKQNSEIPISKFMDVLLSSHSHYISLKHNLPRGQLFQGRFGKTLIETEASLLQVSRYIHLNPIKEQLLRMDMTYQKSRSLRNKQFIRELQNYPWSSYPFYLNYGNGKGNGLVSINPSYIFSLEKTPTRYRRFVEAKISDEDFHNLENLGSN